MRCFVFRQGILFYKRIRLPKLCVFAYAKLVVRQNINTLEIFATFVRKQEFGYGLQFRVIVIDAFEQRQSDFDVIPVVQQKPYVFKNQGIVYAREFRVTFGVHVLDVEQKQIRKSSRTEYCFRSGVTAGFHSRVDSTLAAGGKQTDDSFGLHERFPAAQGHASAGQFVKGSVLFHHVENSGKGHLLADHIQSGRRALFFAPPTADTVLIGEQCVSLWCHDMHPSGAHGSTGSAIRAELSLYHHLWSALLTFRIGAPLATQGAALEKDQRAYPIPIMGIVLLDIKDVGFSFHHGGSRSALGGRCPPNPLAGE